MRGVRIARALCGVGDQRRRVRSTQDLEVLAEEMTHAGGKVVSAGDDRSLVIKKGN
jgi:hypothetical protein